MGLMVLKILKSFLMRYVGKDILLLEWLVRLIVKSEQRHEFRKFEFVSYDFIEKRYTKEK